MGIMVGMRVPILPLTAEVFAGKEDPLVGNIEHISYDAFYNLGAGFILEGTMASGPVYVHPTLFSQLIQTPNDWFLVEIEFKNGKLVLHSITPKINKIFVAPPVTISMQNFATVYDLIVKVQQSGHCKNRTCSNDAQATQLRQWVLIEDDNNGTALMCRKCFENIAKKNPQFYDHPLTPEEKWEGHKENIPVAIVKGWEIPPGTPVPLTPIPFANTRCNLDIITDFLSLLHQGKNYQTTCPTCRKQVTEDYQQWVQVGIGFGEPVCLCRQCFENIESEHPDFYSQLDTIDPFDIRERTLPIPHIKGWELSPTAPVPLWNIPPLEVLGEEI